VMNERFRWVDGRELFDLQADPLQTTDVAAAHPEVVRQMADAYERWWQRVSIDFDRPVRVVIGAEVQPSVTLNAHDWHAPQEQVPWDQSHIRRDLAGSGHWELEAARDDLYRITLRMRPEGIAYEFAAGEVELQAGTLRVAAPLVVGASQVVFEVPIAAGPLRLQSWVRESGKPERGAYFVTIERL